MNFLTRLCMLFNCRHITAELNAHAAAVNRLRAALHPHPQIKPTSASISTAPSSPLRHPWRRSTDA